MVGVLGVVEITGGRRVGSGGGAAVGDLYSGGGEREEVRGGGVRGEERVGEGGEGLVGEGGEGLVVRGGGMVLVVFLVRLAGGGGAGGGSLRFALREGWMRVGAAGGFFSRGFLVRGGFEGVSPGRRVAWFAWMEGWWSISSSVFVAGVSVSSCSFSSSSRLASLASLHS